MLQRTPGTFYVLTYDRGPAPLNTALALMVTRSRLREALATASGFLLWFAGYSAIFWWFLFFSLERVLAGHGVDTFSFGPVQIPKFMGAGFSNLEVTIFCGVAILALLFALCVRYVQHRAKLNALRTRGIADFNGDGKQDRFTDRFLDEL